MVKTYVTAFLCRLRVILKLRLGLGVQCDLQISIIGVERIIKRIGVVPVDIAFKQSTIVFGRTERHINGTSRLLAKLHKDNGRDGSDALEKGDD